MHTSQPHPFLSVRVQDISTPPTLRGFCAGYESGTWREKDLARHIIEWLPEFALDHEERNGITASTCIRAISTAAHNIYTSEKYRKRGEFGEILLHIALRQACESQPAISKVFFKTASNETVKGFDAVHIVGAPGSLELWLGEAKFYDNAAAAIRDAHKSVLEHTNHDYLRSEFLLIGNKLTKTAPHSAELSRLINRNTSLDTIFQRVCFPVFMTYDSQCISNHTATTAAYESDFQAEVRGHFDAFVSKGFPSEVRIHVMLMPLLSKQALVAELDRRLKLCQEL